jgi:type I restriction enzyme M protein
MANERHTERLTRGLLTQFGYYSNDKIIVEEQQSQNNTIAQLLLNASKSGNGAGYPEFIISAKNSDVIIIIECKASNKFHESTTKDKAAQFAVDGALHYASFLKNNFHVIAIGISGETTAELKISTFQWNQYDKRYLTKKFYTIQQYVAYYDIFHYQDKINITEDELMFYAKKLHDEMRDEAKLTEAKKPLLVAALLLALDNDEFVNEYKSIINPKKLANRIIESIAESLELANIAKEKITLLKHEFNWITTHISLIAGEIDHNNPSHHNNSLHKFLVDIQQKVYLFIKKVNNIDIIGRFYSEFVRYTGGDGKGLGIVLTPTHITDLFCDLAEVNKNSKVLDLCAGTGAFLVSAMEKMLSHDPTVAEINNIYQHNLIGCEVEPNMFALACVNMIIRGDGKTNLLQTNCFDIGFINPPYSQKKDEEHELSFTKKLLDSLVVGGIGIVIVPQSSVMNSIINNVYKQAILNAHTLKAVMSMPDELFYPTGTVTCIAIFEAHKPHNSNKNSWFGYWKIDGYKKVRNQGRIDVEMKFTNEIKHIWLDAYWNKREIAGFSILHRVDALDEWLVEAYMTTDYSILNNSSFEDNLRIYATYLFYNKLTATVSSGKQSYKEIDLNLNNWKCFILSDLFEIIGSKTTPKKTIQEYGAGIYPYITTSSNNNGIEGLYDVFTDTGNILTIDSAVKGFCSYQARDFSASDHVEKLIPKFELNVYIGLFLQTIINLEQFRYSYGRKFNQDRIKKTVIRLPSTPNNTPDWQYMEDYIKTLNYSGSL